MKRSVAAAALAAALPLAACGGGRHGADPLSGATSGAYAANALLNSLNATAQTVTRFGYGYGFPWGGRYQQPYRPAVPTPPAAAPQPAPQPDAARTYFR